MVKYNDKQINNDDVSDDQVIKTGNDGVSAFTFPAQGDIAPLTVFAKDMKQAHEEYIKQVERINSIKKQK